MQQQGLGRDAGLARPVGHDDRQRAGQAQLVEDDGAQRRDDVVELAVDLGGERIEMGDELAQRGVAHQRRERAQRQLQRREVLAQRVVQLARDAAPLVLLRSREPVQQLLLQAVGVRQGDGALVDLRLERVARELVALDVGGRAEPVLDLAARAGQRRHARDEPAVRAVVAAQAVFVRHEVAAGDGLAHPGLRAVAVVGVHEFDAAGHVGVAGVAQPLLAAPFGRAEGVGAPEDVGHEVGDGLELRLARGQRLGAARDLFLEVAVVVGELPVQHAAVGR